MKIKECLKSEWSKNENMTRRDFLKAFLKTTLGSRPVSFVLQKGNAVKISCMVFSIFVELYYMYICKKTQKNISLLFQQNFKNLSLQVT